ncbi:Biotin-requiring enzyme [Thermodesulfobium acidiphilum]|uniref:Biotin-requiring enzyme n=1 Tax=Thermodesulfobium acidiphilum TaxID=1794699 RepID=A0A2R4W284_THEAF|nr:lipoyl domain-containing protein [Thermodesulfobium acidiphilum]AWB10806.1 Biotin-requiring enzyme [Thermodesulfobium acidiphilum]
MQILMPEINKDSIRNRLVKWLKKENDIVKIGEEIALIENQKVTSVIKSPFSGKLINMLQENTFINVGQPVAEVVDVLVNISPSLDTNKGLESQAKKTKEEDKRDFDSFVRIPAGSFLKLKSRIDISRSVNFVKRNSISLSNYLFFCILKSYVKYPFFGQGYPISFFELTDNGLESIFSSSDDLFRKVQIEGLRSMDEFKKEKSKIIDFSTNEGLSILFCKEIDLDEVELSLNNKTSLLICTYNRVKFGNEETKGELSLFFQCNFEKNLSFVLNFMKRLKTFLIDPENLIL